MIERADVSGVLSQIRSMQAQMPRPTGVESPVQGLSGVNAPKAPQSAEFGKMLTQALDGVNGLSKQSSSLQEAYLRGDEGVDLAKVMIAMNKSSVATEALVQTRNRLVQAYQTIAKMPV